ncbi:hypothetical protein [Pseudoalteromonas distincta]|uniref:hypothetical protein n=1 Tax=Pseudoalteromonas distincta TaxID=77608 RepID=UPI00241CA5B0|nr:hypothetical protein [Pseudoalteromonas distincta]|tara:strand:- start:3736 stop:4788 length:1053 start_codon:yes stop_codon:yes gene_type:complete
MENLLYQYFSDIDLGDSFFDTLKEDYSEFSAWFNKKASSGEKAYVLYENGNADGFLYLKNETGCLNELEPPLNSQVHLKVGTFKFNSRGTRRGERFIKKIFDHATSAYVEDIYVTVFDKHEYLIRLFLKYGFIVHGSKITPNGTESVLVRKMRLVTGNGLTDYPYIDARTSSNFLLAIYPAFHTRMLPDSILNNESINTIEDVSHSNSIHKIYLCATPLVSTFKPGDIVIIYRTGDGQGPAWYRSVATSVCVIEEYKNISEFTEAEFMKYCGSYSVFSDQELKGFYTQKKYPHIIKFTYNAALSKRLNRKMLIEQVGLDQNERWSALELTKDQLSNILNLGGVNESLVVY